MTTSTHRTSARPPVPAPVTTRPHSRAAARVAPGVTIPCSLLLLLSPSPGRPQTAAANLPAGTPLPVQIDDHLPMRVGQSIQGQLIYPAYADNHLVLPEKTVVTGNVVELHSNHSRRIHARLRGDFTPFDIPVVHFSAITLPDGATVPIRTDNVTDGAPIFRAVAPPPSKGGFIRQGINMGMQVARDDLAMYTAPGKADRLLQFVYGQLPYHPQRIEKNTAWTIETLDPISIPAQPVALPPPATPQLAAPPPAAAAATTPQPPSTWMLEAFLNEALDSSTAHVGQQVRATVAKPIFNPDNTVAVPQGATLVGAVTKAKPARSFGRNAALRFDFQQIVFPSTKAQNIQATLTEADSSDRTLALNSEGEAKSKPKDKVSLPLILALLASRPLDGDRDGGSGGGGLGKNAIGSNGFGLVGRVVGITGGSPNLAAGIGYYGTALALYDRWIARGQQKVFPRDTRIVVQTTARSSEVLRLQKSEAANPPALNGPKP